MFIDDLLNGWSNLRRHLLRTLLSVLGVSIGVAATITMIAVGEGAQQDMVKKIKSLGSNLIVVLAHNPHRRAVHARETGSTLSMADAAAIETQIPEVAAAAAVVSLKTQAIHGSRNRAVRIQGITPAFFRVRHWSVAQGTSFMNLDYQNAATVALLGDTVAEHLFPGQNPVGQDVRLGSVRFTIVGVLEPKGQNLQGKDQDDVILVPLRTAQSRLLGRRRVNSQAITAVLVEVKKKSWMDTATAKITRLLRQRHGLNSAAQKDDFSIHDLTEIAKTRQQAERVFRGFLLTVAAISLLVGGIGIMNIMLVAVTERRREIGLRLAVGATPGDIHRQFLTETALMTLMGGFFGTLLGVTAAWVIGKIFHWPIGFNIEAILWVLLFCGGLGIFFGLYPAVRAARLDPIQAIRHD
ncbi:MAG TPA: FtsX-like permease family protein [Methylothermaceae bacterium]|nr:FtsX-like permease family protein [Methylothermaceae bacterium]